MNRQFDELSRSLAEDVSRREALRRFGLGLAGVLLASFGLSSAAWANPCPKGLLKCGTGKNFCCYDPNVAVCCGTTCCPNTPGCCGNSCGCPSGYKCCCDASGNCGCVPVTALCGGL